MSKSKDYIDGNVMSSGMYDLNWKVGVHDMIRNEVGEQTIKCEIDQEIYVHCSAMHHFPGKL